MGVGRASLAATAFVTCAYVLSQMDWFHDSRLWWRHFPQIIECVQPPLHWVNAS